MPLEPALTPWSMDAGRARPGEDLVGVGADLEPGTLLAAYRAGLFPMGAGEAGAGPLGWWSPDPRGVLRAGDLRLNRSLRRAARGFTIRVDTALPEVIDGCADPGRPDGWITPELRAAYLRLHALGWVHSVEAWDQDGLAGGLYGVAVGGLFAAESKFHRVSGASKAAVLGLIRLMEQGEPGWLVDVQWPTPYLAALGVRETSRDHYRRLLGQVLPLPLPPAFASAGAATVRGRDPAG